MPAIAPKHASFTRNLLSASASDDMSEAVRQWTFFKSCKPGPDITRCQLCGAIPGEFAVIKNEKNDATLAIGHDCYQKLINFRLTGELSALHPKHGQASRGLVRKFLLNSVGNNVFISASKKRRKYQMFLDWFYGQDNFSGNIREILAYMRKRKLPPSVAAAEVLVKYYNAVRELPAEMVFKEWELMAARRLGIQIPEQLTTDRSQTIRTQIEELDAARRLPPPRTL